MKLSITFSFGKNWLRYVKYVASEDIINIAKLSLRKFVDNRFDFNGKTFVDIGCGSGIFSLSAAMLGCKKIISIDVDSSSIEATKLLQKKFSYLIPDGVEWIVKEGSILDANLTGELENCADFLYSWGVLHHTGNLELAMKNASRLVKQDGLAYIALYNRTDASNWWLNIKKIYNSSLLPVKFIMVVLFTAFLTFEDVRKGRGLNMFDKNRGMYKWTDVIDWLGGLPYEPIDVKDTVEFWNNCGFVATKTAPTVYHLPTYPSGFWKKYFVYLKMVGLGCNEFLFEKKK